MPSAVQLPTMARLPVLSAPTANDPAGLTRLFHRAQLQLARAVADEEPTDGGTRLRNPDLRPLPIAHCVLDAALDPGETPAAFVGRIDTDADDPVRGWTLNPSVSPDRTGPLSDHLLATGWRAVTRDVLHLTRWRGEPADTPTGWTVLPTRAAYGPFARLAAERFATEVEADAAVRQWDDPHLDGWVALRSGVAVAAVSLLNDGETGTVADLYVAPAERGRGWGRRLLARSVEAGGRAGHRRLLTGVPVNSTALFATAGFTPVGRWTQYVRL